MKKIAVDIDNTICETTEHFGAVAEVYNKEVLHKDGPINYNRAIPRGDDWTEEEKRTAILLFGNGNRKCYREIAKLLNRSEWAVANFLRNYGYSYKLSKFWKDSEIEYLKNNYQSMTYQKMAEELGRTEKAVMAKAEKLGYQKKLKKNNM